MITLLYVDDEPGLLEIGKLFLETMPGFEVDTVTSAAAALGTLSRKAYDAIVSDYQMPGMDGIAFLKAVRTSGNPLPFILFTGRGREEVVIQALNEGADFYLQKGGDPNSQFAELAHKVRLAVQQRRTEASIRDHERREAEILNFLPDATFAIDRAGTVISWNKAIEDLTGISAADMVGKGNHEYAIPFYGTRRKILIDLIFEPDDVIARDYTNITRDKNLLIAETTLPRPKGRPVVLMGKAGPLCDKDGNIAGAIESIRDITEQKLAGDALRQSEEKYRYHVEVIQDIIFSLDATGMILYVSPQTTDQLGTGPEEMQGRHFSEFVHPDDVSRIAANIRNITVMDVPVKSEEFRLRRKDATYRWFEDRTIPHMTAEGKRIQVGTLRDITDRRNAEIELRASEEKYRRFIETSIEGIWSMDAGFVTTFVNRKMADMLGYTTEEMIGRPISAFMDPLDLADNTRKMENRRRGDNDFYERRFRKKDGSGVWMAVSATALSEPDGSFAGSFAMLTDITARKEAEAELKRKNDELASAYEQLAASDEELRSQYEELARGEQKIRESEEKFQSVVETAPDAIYISQAERFVYVNPAMVRLMGAASADQLLGMPIYERIHSASRAAARERVRLVDVDHQGGGMTGMTYVRLDGTTIEVESSVAAFRYGRSWAGLVMLRDISARLAAEEALKKNLEELARSQKELRKSERKYRDLFSNAILGIFRSTPDGRYLDMNPAFAHIAGFRSPEEMMEKVRNIQELYVRPEDRKNLGELLARDGEIHGFETEIRRTDKSTIWISIHAKTTKAKNTGQIISFDGTIEDITARKHAEYELRAAHEQLTASEEELRSQFDELSAAQAELRKQQQQLSEITEMIPGLVYQFYARPDGSLGLYHVSSRGREIFGFSGTTSDFFGWFTAHVDPRDHDDFLRSISEAVRDEKIWNFEGRFIRPSGEPIWFQGTSRPVRRGPELVFNGILLDITDRKAAERALRESEQKFRAIVETSEEGIWIIDNDFLTVFVNRKMEEILGYPPAEMTGRPVWDFVLPEESGSMKELLLRRKTGKPEQYEHRWVRKDGNVIRCRTFGSPLRLPDGTYLGSVGRFTDITCARD